MLAAADELDRLRAENAALLEVVEAARAWACLNSQWNHDALMDAVVALDQERGHE